MINQKLFIFGIFHSPTPRAARTYSDQEAHSMSSKTKIVVLHMKEIIYTGIFLLFLIVLGVLMFFMFDPGKAKSVSTIRLPFILPASTVLPLNLTETALTWKLLSMHRKSVPSIWKISAKVLPPCFRL